MYDDKIMMTTDVSKQLEILERIIQNPDTKINDLIDSEFNSLYVDLVISLSQFLMNKDHTITKNAKNDGERFKNWLLDRYVEIYDNNTDLSIGDFIEQINAIRNAIGHGKYIIDKETLNIHLLDRQKGEISYKWMRDMIENLFSNNKNKLKKLPIKTGYIAYLNENIDIDNIEETIKNIYVFEYNITSENENFNPKGLELIQREIYKYKYMCNDIARDPIRLNEWVETLKNCKDVASLSNIDFNYEPKTMDKLSADVKDKLRNVIKDNYDILKNTNNEGRKTFFEGFMNDFYFDSNYTMQIDKAYSQIGKVARLAEVNMNKTYNEIKMENPYLPPTNNQMLLATTLVKFNMLYSYNDDNILREYMDFSKLDLSGFNPTINFDVTKNAYKNETEKIKMLEKDITKKYKKYEGMRKIPNPTQDKLDIMTGINVNMYTSLFDILEKQDQIRKKRFAKNETINNEDLYVKNKMIITHLRNSITHGNIEINSRIKQSDMSTCEITFRDFDIETKKQTFELTTTLDKLNKICDYNAIMNLLNQNPNYKKEVKSYSGFANICIILTAILMEIMMIVFYVVIAK